MPTTEFINLDARTLLAMAEDRHGDPDTIIGPHTAALLRSMAARIERLDGQHAHATKEASLAAFAEGAHRGVQRVLSRSNVADPNRRRIRVKDVEIIQSAIRDGRVRRIEATLIVPTADVRPVPIGRKGWSLLDL